jgi:UDP-3-O-[3-hydroxymyristoyl] glucosamine N-acyltransferase
MNFTIKEAAEFIGGKITGDENINISNVARIEEANKGDLTFLYHPAYEKYFSSTQASAILVKPDFKKTRADICYIEVESPDKAFGDIIDNYFSPEFPLEGIDSTAFIHGEAKIAKDVVLGKNVVISAGCKIGNNVKIFHNTVLLENVEIGNDTIVFQNVSVRENCTIGKRGIIHAGAVIGADGFGFNPDSKGVYKKIPQIGNVVICDDVEIGANTTIDRAATGSTIVGRGSKIDNLVQIAHNVIIGEDTVISAQTGIAGSTRVGSHCMFGGQVGIVDHIEISDNVLFAAGSLATKSIKPGYYFGLPAKEIKTSYKLEAHIRKLPEYSERIKELEKEIKDLRDQLAHNNS